MGCRCTGELRAQVQAVTGFVRTCRLPAVAPADAAGTSCSCSTGYACSTLLSALADCSQMKSPHLQLFPSLAGLPQNLFRVARRFYLLYQQHTTDAFNARAKEFLGPNDGSAFHFVRWMGPQVRLLRPATSSARQELALDARCMQPCRHPAQSACTHADWLP